MAKKKTGFKDSSARRYRFGVINPESPSQLILQNEKGQDTITVIKESLDKNPDCKRQYLGMVVMPSGSRMTLYAYRKKKKKGHKHKHARNNGILHLKHITLM